MIGPHEGRELELMLAGEKHLAVFHDALIDGHQIPEEIIPDRSFAPYVKSGLFIRRGKDVYAPRSDVTIRYVCFATETQQWRADAFFWIVSHTIEKGLKGDPASEMMIGRLLGYQEGDIEEYLSRLHSLPLRTAYRSP